MLAEEVSEWRRVLQWDYTRSAALVRRYVELRVLSGVALAVDNEIAGFLYYVHDDTKSLIGDLYLREGERTAAHQEQLLAAGISRMVVDPGIARVEAQFMLLDSDPELHLPFCESASAYERYFMRLDLQTARLAAMPPKRPVYFESWTDHYLEATASLIAASYQDHIDGHINDQYRSLSGARRFLQNIVNYPGCGVFSREASIAAFDGYSGQLCGVCLTGLVSPEAGHITQLCVSPNMRGSRVGYELMRRSAEALAGTGCRWASLTVSAANTGALGLYERSGFTRVRCFPAYIWQGLGSPLLYT